MTRLLVLLVSLFLISLPAPAEEAKTCIIPAKVIHDMKAVGGTLAASLYGEKGKNFVDAANAFLGVHRTETDVMIFTQEGYQSRVILFKDGCFSGAGDFPPDLVKAWLEMADRAGA